MYELVACSSLLLFFMIFVVKLFFVTIVKYIIIFQW